MMRAYFRVHLLLVSDVLQTIQLCTDRDQTDVVGDLSVCLDGMTVDPEMFAKAEVDHQSEWVVLVEEPEQLLQKLQRL